MKSCRDWNSNTLSNIIHYGKHNYEAMEPLKWGVLLEKKASKESSK